MNYEASSIADLTYFLTKMQLIHKIVSCLLQRRISSAKSEGEDAEPSRNSASAPPLEDEDRVGFGEKVPL